MNWIFEAYSNVYSTAMMGETHAPSHVAVAKKPGLIARLQTRLSRH
jgi:hypothetical protein